jgi:hypothetical protein
VRFIDEPGGGEESAYGCRCGQDHDGHHAPRNDDKTIVIVVIGLIFLSREIVRCKKGGIKIYFIIKLLMFTIFSERSSEGR